MAPRIKTAILVSISILLATLGFVSFLFVNALSGFRVAEKIPLEKVEIAKTQDLVVLRYQGLELRESSTNYEQANRSERFLYRTWHTHKLALNVQNKLNWALGFLTFGFCGALLSLLILFQGFPKKPSQNSQQIISKRPPWGPLILLLGIGLYFGIALNKAKILEKELVQKIPLSRASLTFTSDTTVKVEFGRFSREVGINDFQTALERDPYLYLNSKGDGKIGFRENLRVFTLTSTLMMVGFALMSVALVFSWWIRLRKKPV